jgi:PAS domain S-box-containing protein
MKATGCEGWERKAYENCGVTCADSWAEPFNFCSDLVVVLDLNNRTIVHVNKQFVREIAPAHRAVGLSFLTDLIQPSDRPAVETAMSNAFCPGVDYEPGKNLHVATSVNTLVLGVLGQYPIYRSYDWKFTKSEDDKFFLCLGRLMTVLNAERHKDEAEMMDFFDNAPIAMHWLGGTGNIIWANKKEMQVMRFLRLDNVGPVLHMLRRVYVGSGIHMLGLTYVGYAIWCVSDTARLDPTQVLGYTAEEYIGQPIAKFCPDEQELILNIFHNLGTGNSIHDVPVRFRRKDGRIQHLLIDSNVNWNVDGSFNHTRCFIRDDTERLVRETRLKLQQKQLEELAKTKEALLRKVRS